MPRQFTDDEMRQRIALQKKALEITCYVVGAGAFSVFIRWLQTMLAFNEDGLVDRSIFNFLVPLMVIIAGYIFLRFVDRFRADRWYVPDDFYDAFYNPGRLYTAIRWLIGVIMVVGSLLLFASAETDKDASFLRVLALVGVLDGLAFPLVLSSANKPHASAIKTVCFLMFLPVLFFCVWLVVLYKVNSINPVVWQYAPEAAAIILSMIAFFRAAGWAYGAPNTWRSMFFSMLAAAVDIMVIADERYMGMQLMYFASAMMLVMYNWVLITNFQRRPKPEREQPNDGFERL